MTLKKKLLGLFFLVFVLAIASFFYFSYQTNKKILFNEYRLRGGRNFRDPRQPGPLFL